MGNWGENHLLTELNLIMLIIALSADGLGLQLTVRDYKTG